MTASEVPSTSNVERKVGLWKFLTKSGVGAQCSYLISEVLGH